jgi:hypothetical protein
MQDIVDKFDRAKELLERAGTDFSPDEAAAIGQELMELGVDAIGELITSARRIAVAMETIAENTKPLKADLIEGVCVPIELDAERLRPLVEGILADNGLRSPHAPRGR